MKMSEEQLKIMITMNIVDRCTIDRLKDERIERYSFGNKQLGDIVQTIVKNICFIQCCVTDQDKETKTLEENNNFRKEAFNNDVSLLCEGIHSPDFTGKCHKCNEQIFVKKQETKA